MTLIFKEKFIQKCVALCPDMRFLYYYNSYPSKWKTYAQIKTQYRNLFTINNQMLRTGIITPEYEEMRLDIDTKENGVKSLKSSVKTAEYIIKILEKHNIKYSLYYSGGSGLHFHILYYKHNINFENQKLVRELICKYIGIYDLIDRQLLSNNQMMTCEGYQKRNSTSKYLKIYIEREKREEKEILNYIKQNYLKVLINEDFFNQITTLNKDILHFVNTEYKAYTHQIRAKTKPIKEDFISADTYTTLKNNTGEVKTSENVILKHLVTFSKIYNSGCNSTNQFYSIIVTYLYTATKDYERTLYYFNYFFDILKVNDNLTCSREDKVKIIINNYNLGKTKIFFQNDYVTKEKFWNEYYSLFPKQAGVFAR